MMGNKKTKGSFTQPKDERRAAWYLRKVPLLEGVSAENILSLAALVELREYGRHQVVYLPGDPGEQVYFIQGGRVKCSKVSREGKEVTLDYYGAGDVFGELCVFEGAPHEEMAEAMKNTIIVAVPRENLKELLEHDPAFGLRFAHVLGQRRRQLELRLNHLMFRDVPTKLALLLLELGRDHGLETEDGVKLDLKITHQEMASLIGTTRETVSLALTAFKKRNLVRFGRKTVMLVDQEGLRGLCGGTER